MITKFMGLLLFLVGFALLILAVLALLGFVEPRGLFERILMFAGGLILAALGYLMAREQPMG
jgi:ABC-type transport system involved in multi-copper enzyme maturation permease subunit